MRWVRSILLSVGIWGGMASDVSAVAPNFGDMAVVVAKGYFSKDISSSASMSDCFLFLNSHGIKFDLYDLLDPSIAVAKEDFARVIGQADLLFLGEGVLQSGRIVLPVGIETWLDYCTLNDVKIEVLWSRFNERVKVGHLPEVSVFFENN